MEEKMKEYFITKDISKRSELLKELVLNCPVNGQEFFYKAFKKEHNLAMKLIAIRGYANYATEKEVEVLMNKLSKLFKNEREINPYNYKEYEIMRSKFLMSYLIEKYNYNCFIKFNRQLQKYYENMPNNLKELYTCDEDGNLYSVEDSQEEQKSLKDFYKYKTIKMMKVIFILSFIPYIIILLTAVYCAIVGFEFFSDTSYGLEGFLDTIIILGLIFWPIFLVCFIYQIIYLVVIHVIKKTSLKNK